MPLKDDFEFKLLLWIRDFLHSNPDFHLNIINNFIYKADWLQNFTFPFPKFVIHLDYNMNIRKAFATLNTTANFNSNFEYKFSDDASDKLYHILICNDFILNLLIGNK